jgi:hypothetical protein
MKEFKLEDGTIITANDIVVGEAVMVGETSAPDGDHVVVIEDKSVVITVKDGLITEVKDVEIEETEEVETEPVKSFGVNEVKKMLEEEKELMNSILLDYQNEIQLVIENLVKRINDLEIEVTKKDEVAKEELAKLSTQVAKKSKLINDDNKGIVASKLGKQGNSIEEMRKLIQNQK